MAGLPNAGLPPNSYPNLSSYGGGGFHPFHSFNPTDGAFFSAVAFVTGNLAATGAAALEAALVAAQTAFVNKNPGTKASVFVFYMHLAEKVGGVQATIGWCSGPNDLTGQRRSDASPLELAPQFVV